MFCCRTSCIHKPEEFVASVDPRVGLLGAMQSLFEGSMYTFVFLWTPALSPDGEHLPHGMIFACFMVSSMAGSALAGRLLAHGSGYVSLVHSLTRSLT